MGRQILLEDVPASQPAPRPHPVRGVSPGLCQRDGYVEHPLLHFSAIDHRAYQVRIAEQAAQEDLLVVLPTGLGKTVIAALAAARRFDAYPNGKVVIVAPTRPLVQQHARLLRRAFNLAGGAIAALTGDEAPQTRRRRFVSAQIISSTPQGLVEDVEAERINLKDVVLLVVDEAHRAVGDYAYVPLLRHYRSQAAQPRLLGLTASPGGQKKRIKQVVTNLGVERVEALTEEDPEVVEHVPGTHVERHPVELSSTCQEFRAALVGVFQDRLGKLKPFVRKGQAWDQIPKTQLLGIGGAIRGRLGTPGRGRGFLFAALLHQGAAVEANHCLELLETQGLVPLKDYLTRLASSNEASRSQRSFLKDERVQTVLAKLQAPGADLAHPKEEALVGVVRDQLAKTPEGRILVFAQYRDTVRRIVHILAEAGVHAERFVGQADREGDDGLDQATQSDVLAGFAAGAFPVLVATCVAEEGLHVPDVNLVVGYEPLVSEIRTIQRRGRTGRTGLGRVIILWARGTRDDRHGRVEGAREENMGRIVRGMSRGAKAAAAGPA